MSSTPTRSSDSTGADPAEADHFDTRSSRRRRISMIAGLTFAIATFGVWIYAIFIYDPVRQVDELADRTFPRAAEQVCAVAESKLAALPRAETSATPADRAAVIDRADEVLSAMVADLQPLVPRDQAEVTTGLDEWVNDWKHHIEDRQRYAESLRHDHDARFEERTKGKKQLSLAIDGFATANRMASCTTPGDVG